MYDNGTEAQLASSAVNGSSVGSGTCDSIADSPDGTDSGSGGPCVSVPVVLPNALWRLYLGKAGGWQPRWRAGLLALVVVGSFVVSGLLFGLLINSNRHRSLLEAMFPKKVLAPLQQVGPVWSGGTGLCSAHVRSGNFAMFTKAAGSRAGVLLFSSDNLVRQLSNARPRSLVLLVG